LGSGGNDEPGATNIARVRPRIFLSYARSNLEHARYLRERIEAELGAGSVWHDVRDLGGDHWWSEIESAIRRESGVEHVVLVSSRDALSRPVVIDEWRLADRDGKTVTPVFWSAREGFTPPEIETLPARLRAKSLIDLSLEPANAWAKFMARLQQPGRGQRRPYMAPPLPEAFVQRPAEFVRLKSALLDARGDAIAITASLRGAGGFGKTVLAAALARDPEIQEAFYDGVLWVTLGQEPRLAELICDLIGVMRPSRVALTDVSIASSRLMESLRHRRCLLVVDDAWQWAHLQWFMGDAPGTARLVTTRRDELLPDGVTRVVVDAMTATEAAALLTRGLTPGVDTEEARILTELRAERLGDWPILLSLVNGFLRGRVRLGQPLFEAVRAVIERLDHRGITAFDRALESERSAAIDATVTASLALLEDLDGRIQRRGILATAPRCCVSKGIPVGSPPWRCWPPASSCREAAR
jgi:hypothetical protein